MPQFKLKGGDVEWKGRGGVKQAGLAQGGGREGQQKERETIGNRKERQQVEAAFVCALVFCFLFNICLTEASLCVVYATN